MTPTTYNPSHESQPAANNSQRSYLILRRVIFILVLLFIIVRVSIFSAWLVLKPLLPLVTVSQFSLSYDPKYQSNIDQTIRFTIQNPNKKIKVYFYYYEVCLSCERMIPSRASLERDNLSFDVEKKAQKDLIVKLRGLGTERRRCGVPNWDRKASGDNKKFSGNMKNGVKMFVGMKYSALNDWLSRRKVIVVFCKAKVYFFTADGKGKLQTRGQENCLVHFYY